MFKGISVVVVPVKNRKKAIEFYKKKLGMKVATDAADMNWVELAVPKSKGTTIALIQPDPKWGKKMYEDTVKFIGENTGIIFNTDDIKAAYKELKEKGVNISKPEKQEWGGWWAEFEDLDGNEYGLAQE